MSKRYVVTIQDKDNRKFQVNVYGTQSSSVVTTTPRGPTGISAYEHALNNGFTGTLDDWLSSLKGNSAYDVALNNGFVGTEDEWLNHIRLTAKLENQGQILTNDGQDTYWISLEDKLNDSDLQWDLGQIQ